LLFSLRRLTDVFDREGSPASKHAVDVMRKYQLDLSAHRSQLLTEQMCMEADYVVCVASGMAFKVTEKFPQIKERDGVLAVFTRDVPDPWHMSYDTYMENIAQNEEMTRDFLDKHVTW
jgi:protein-tyrosine-phosphatase